MALYRYFLPVCHVFPLISRILRFNPPYNTDLIPKQIMGKSRKLIHGEDHLILLCERIHFFLTIIE